MGLVPISVATLVAAVAGCSSDDNQGQLFDLDARDDRGSCMNFSEDVGPEVTSPTTVPCSDEHTHEIIKILDSKETVYPGFEALEAEAQSECLKAFEPYVKTNPFDSQLFVSWMLPTLKSWEDEQDRQIICVVGEHGGGTLPPRSVYQSGL
jgi:hypothetical protein